MAPCWPMQQIWDALQVRSVSLPSPPPIPMRWSDHVVSSGMPAAKAAAICKIVEREVEWHFQRLQ